MMPYAMMAATLLMEQHFWTYVSFPTPICVHNLPSDATIISKYPSPFTSLNLVTALTSYFKMEPSVR